MELDENMMAAIVCEMMGWTYDEYMNQPATFLRVVREKIIAQGQAQKRLDQLRGK